MLLGFILAFCISDSNVFAEEREISEEQLNDFILSTGAPNELLERWDYDQKLDLYLKSTNSTIIFDTTEITEFTKDSITGELIETPNDSNIIMPMATIPSKELQVSHDVWTLIDTDQTKYKSVYANYSWNFTKYGNQIPLWDFFYLCLTVPTTEINKPKTAIPSPAFVPLAYPKPDEL